MLIICSDGGNSRILCTVSTRVPNNRILCIVSTLVPNSRILCNVSTLVPTKTLHFVTFYKTADFREKLVKKFPYVMEQDGSFPYSQQPC